MLWLTGTRGAGKSAIMRRLAEGCQQRGVNAASFFFFPEDPTRNTRSLVATLLYQILALNPNARSYIAKVISDIPLIFRGSMSMQFAHLMSALLNTFCTDLHHPIILLIDAINECGTARAAREMVHILHALVTRDGSPFIAMVSSRTEPHLL